MKSSRIIFSTRYLVLLIAGSLSTPAAWGESLGTGFNSAPLWGGMPLNSGFSPWSMGGSPWSSGFSPWSMGGSPWSSGFSPWGSSMMPWASSNTGGNSWGNNSWMPWSSGSGFSGRRHNNDWVTSMFLMNSLNNQPPWNAGMLPNYPYPAPAGNQNFPAQQPQTLFYPQPITPAQTTNSPNTNPAAAQSALEASNFPAATTGFSPFLDTSTPNHSTAVVTSPQQQSVVPTPSPNLTGKTLVFPDGSQY